MQTKIETFNNGAYVTLNVNTVNGMWNVLLRAPSGQVHDKVSCDNRRAAGEYYRAFKAIARNL